MAKEEIHIPQNEHEFRVLVLTGIAQLQTDVAHIKNNGCLRSSEHDTIDVRVAALESDSRWQKIITFIASLIGGGAAGGLTGKL